MKYFLTISIILFSVNSFFCQKNEIKFKLETENSLIEYLNRNDVLYSLEEIATLKDIQAFSKYSKEEKLVVPEAFFFNKDGYLIKNSSKSINCGSSVKHLKKLSSAKYNVNEKFTDWINEFTFLDKKVDSENYDLYILINWAIFLDDYNEVSFNWYKSIKEKKELKIKVILVNLDVQENWNLNENQKEYLGI